VAPFLLFLQRAKQGRNETRLSADARLEITIMNSLCRGVLCENTTVLGVALVAARLSAGSKFSETREVAGVFIGNNPDQKREGEKGGDCQFPVAPGHRIIFWITHFAFLFTVTNKFVSAGGGYSHLTC
jgi:hypothetical protein